MTTYTYSTTDFSSTINLDILTTEVAESTISVSLNDIVSSGGNVTFTFSGTLSASEETSLDTIVATHDGTVDEADITQTWTTSADTDVVISPKGTGTVKVPDGYEANIQENSLVNKQYIDNNVASSAHAHNIDDLGDVQLDVLADGQQLVYNATGGYWENQDSAGGLADSHTITTTTVTAYAIGDYVVVLVDTTSNAVTVTLPAASSNAGKFFHVKWKAGPRSNKVTIDTQGSETIDGHSSVIPNTRYTSLQLISDGTNWFII